MKNKLKPQAVKAAPQSSLLPWRIVSIKDAILVKSPEGCRIAELRIPRGDINNANARLIVRAVNSHAELVATCAKVARSIKWGYTHERMTGDEQYDMLDEQYDMLIAALKSAREEI